jgi:type I restriction enzyme S subunit
MKLGQQRIEELCLKVTSGGTPNTRKPEFYGGNIPWLKTQEVDFNRIYNTDTFITEEGLKNSSAKWIPSNSVIIAMYGATAGRIAINKIPLTTNQACCNLVIDEEKADYRFIYYNLLSRFDSIANMAIGGAQQNLNAGMIKELPIDLPDLPTQKAIAEILSSLDDKIELNNQINENLEALAQALFKQWFVDFEFLNENGEPYKSSGGEMIDSELGEIPKGWKIESLSKIASLEKSSVKPFEKPNEDFFHYSLPEFDSGKIPSIEKGEAILSSKYKVISNSILFSKLNPRIPRVWPVINCKLNSVCSTEFQVIKPEKEKYFSFINSLLNSEEYIKSIQTKVTGTSSSHQRVNPKDIINYLLPLPTNSTIELFQTSTFHLFEKVFEHRSENQSLKNLRDTLLPKLISGELEVNESLLEPTF